MFAKRPKRGEEDDDLLKFQEEYLKAKASGDSTPAAAKVARVAKPETGDNLDAEPTPPRSTSVGEVHQGQPIAAKPEGDITEKDQPMDVTSAVLLERVVEKSNVSAFLRGFDAPQSSATGFPIVPKLPSQLLTATDTTEASTKPKVKRKSLFMQQMEAKKQTAKSETIKSAPSAQTGDATVENVTQRCGVMKTDVSSMLSDVSKENEQKLAGMSIEEISAEQQQLASMLDPGLIALLKNRTTFKTKKPDQPQANPPPVIIPSDVNMDTEETITFKKDTVEPIKSEDLPFEPDNRWLHMDHVEHDKLRWLTPVDNKKESKQPQEKVSARFDFLGGLVNPHTDMSMQSGLHHHGEEPASAGYTLEELYVLVRSLHTSQKVLALSTIANVLRRASAGDYQHMVTTSITKSLLDSDIVLLLRYALDEKSDLVIAAAVSAWHSLLVNQSDMGMLRHLRSSLYGHIIPELSTIEPPPPESEEEEIEREEEQYLEILRRDVIAGLMLMDYLPRLRYVLEIVRPQKIICCQILDILCRMVMTSSEIAYNLSRTPRLVQVICEEFLPLTNITQSSGDVDEVAHKKPLAEAMRFMRHLCASGRSMCKTLLKDHQLMDRILSYVTSELTCAAESEEQELVVESLLTWRTITLYGLSLEYYNNVRSSLVTRLTHEKNTQIKSSIICLLSAFLSAAVCTEHSKPTVTFSDDPSSRPAVELTSTLSWTEVGGLIDSVYSLTFREMERLIHSYTDEHASYEMSELFSALDFLTMYLTHARVQSIHIETSVTSVTVISDVTRLTRDLLKSTAFSKLLSNIRKNSIILSELGYLTTEISPILPALSTTCKTIPEPEGTTSDNSDQSQAFIHQILSLQSIINLLNVCLKLDFTSIEPVCLELLSHVDIQTYIRRVAYNKVTSNTINYFSQIECNALVDVCKLALNIPASHTRDLHRLSLALVPNLANSSLKQLYQLMNEVVFSQSMFRSHFGDKSVLESDAVFGECLAALPSISNSYISVALPLGKLLQHSRNLSDRNASKTSNMYTKHSTLDLLPDDWPFLPIMHLYQTSSSRAANEPLPPDTGLLLKNTLQFVYLIEKSCADILVSVKNHAKIARIMCCFLLDNDVFFEPDMQRSLSALLSSYCKSLHRVDFSLPVPGLHSFSDLYKAFLEQYEAISFGNEIFSQYLLLPMIQRQPLEYRKVVWSEHPLTLRSVQVKPQQLEFAIEELLYPEETDTSIVMLMARYLLSGNVTLRRNQTMYIVALHHVNRFMFTKDGTAEDIKLTLLKSAKNCTVQELCDHLLFYKEYSSGEATNSGETRSDFGIVCYSKLPQSRCDRLKLV